MPQKQTRCEVEFAYPQTPIVWHDWQVLPSICKRSKSALILQDMQPAPCEPAGLVDEGDTSKPEKESESPSASDKKLKRRFSLSKSSKSTKLKSSKKLPVVPYKRVPFTADVSAYILRLYLRNSFLELPEHAA